MAKVEIKMGEIGGGGGFVDKGTFNHTSLSTTSVTWSLANISNASSYDLFNNFVPVLDRGLYDAINLNNGYLDYEWSYDASTKILTLTISGNTNYVWIASNSSSNMTVRIYATI